MIGDQEARSIARQCLDALQPSLRACRDGSLARSSTTAVVDVVCKGGASDEWLARRKMIGLVPLRSCSSLSFRTFLIDRDWGKWK